MDKYGTLEGDLSALSTQVSTDIPIYLSMDGKGFLSRKIESAPSDSSLNSVIPNASEEDFVMQQFKGSGNTAFVSLARRDLVDEMLESFGKQNFKVLGLTIGPFLGIKLLRIFDQLPSEIKIGKNTISYDRSEMEITGYKKVLDNEPPIDYEVDEQPLSSDYLLPYYHALTYFMHDEDALSYPPVSFQFEEYASRRLFTFAGWSALLIFFLILMINMWFFNSYSAKKQKLESLLVGNKELLSSLKTMNEELSWKEKFLNQAGILKNTRLSYYADKIASDLPEDITLDKMEIYPVISKVKKQKEIELQPEKIEIDGMAENSELVNDWINHLKEQPWIEDVSVVNYSKEENAVKGFFSLEIKIVHKKEE